MTPPRQPYQMSLRELEAMLRDMLAARKWRNQMDRDRGAAPWLTHGRVKQYRDTIRACNKREARLVEVVPNA